MCVDVLFLLQTPLSDLCVFERLFNASHAWVLFSIFDIIKGGEVNEDQVI